MQPAGSGFYPGFIFVFLEEFCAFRLIFFSRFLLFLFHIFFELLHDVLDLVLCELRFTPDGVLYAGGEYIGIDIYFLPAQVRSDIHTDAIADLVFLVF